MAAAEDFVHLYVDEPKWLRIFLMYVLREGGQAGPAVADTLLELLLREWAREPDRPSAAAARRQREGEIMALLDNPRAGYDAHHALVLVQMLNFRPGQLYLYEKVCALGVCVGCVLKGMEGAKGGEISCSRVHAISSCIKVAECFEE